MPTVQSTKFDLLLQKLKKTVEERQENPNMELVQELLDLFSNCTRLNIGGSDVIVLDRVSVKHTQEEHEEIFLPLPSTTPKAPSPISVVESNEANNQFVTTKEVADFFNITQETVRDWINKGLLTGIQNTKRGKILIPRSEFEFLKHKKQQGDAVYNQLKDRWFGDKKEEWEIDYSDEDFEL